MLRRAVTVVAFAATFVTLLVAPVFAATAAPTAPRSPSAYPGVDGVRLFWFTPATTNGGLTGYRVYRAAAGADPALLGEVPVSAPTRTYYDSAVEAGQTWTYTVAAYNDAGESVPSTALTVTIPEPVEAGTVDAFVVDSQAWGDGASWAFAAPGDTVEVSGTHARFTVRGVSAATSPQGARDVTWRVGSMVDGARLAPGTYPTKDSFTPGAGTVELGASLNPCSNAAGSLTVTEASFLSDGTPLVFSATFTYQCGGGTTYGVVRWNAHDSFEAVTTSSPGVDFANVGVGKTADRELVLHNAGASAQPLGTAAVSGTDAGDFAVVTDTCSGATLDPGATCALGLRVTPSVAGTRVAHVALPDGTARGGRDVRLTAWGVAPPSAPSLYVLPALRAVTMSWQYPSTNGPITGYRLYRGTSPDALAPLADLPGSQATVRTYLDTDVTPGTEYHYAVVASNAGGDSALSATVAVTPYATGIVYAVTKGGEQYGLATAGENGISIDVAGEEHDHDMPALSPDGTTVVYLSDRDNPGSYSLWRKPLYAPLSSAVRLTSAADADDVTPVWSPDGTRIAFTRFTSSGPAVYVVPAAGGAATPVPGTAGDAYPSWSPNGRLLAVTDVAATPPVLAVTSLDGSYRRTVAGSSGGVDPSWSPDGTTLAFVRLSGESVAQVATLPVGGGTPSLLTPASTYVSSADWRPDGSEIVYEAVGTEWWTYFYAVTPAGVSRPLSVQTASDETSVAPAGPRAAYVAGIVPPVSGLAASLGSGRATLSWTPPVGTAYVVVRRSVAGGDAPTSPDDGAAVYSGTASSVTATGLANGSAYAFSVFAVSSLGDVSPAATRLVRPAAVPVVSPNGSVLGALHGTGPSFVARWGAGALGAGQVYDVQVGTRTRRPDGTWSSVTFKALATGTTATSAVVPAAAGRTYYLRARVRDASGNVTAFSTPAVAPVPYDDRSLSASGVWTSQSAAGRFAGTVRVASAAGARLSFTTEASSFALVADRCASCGGVRVYVDGVLKATVTTYATKTLTRQVVWSASFSGVRRHTVSFVVVGTAGRPAVRIDGLVARR